MRAVFLQTVYESHLHFSAPQNRFWRGNVSVHVSGERERLRAAVSGDVSGTAHMVFGAAKMGVFFAEQAGDKNGLP